MSREVLDDPALTSVAKGARKENAKCQSNL
jgi:hypothetical protein